MIRGRWISRGWITCEWLTRSELVDRTLDSQGAAVENMGVDHGRPNIFVAEEDLDGSDIGPILEQMRCERVTKGVGRDALGQMRTGRGTANRALRASFREVVSANDP